MNSNRYGNAWPYPKLWSKTDFDASAKSLMIVQKKLFGNPLLFHFVLTGVADNEQTKSLIKEYFASLPVYASREEKKVVLKHNIPKEISETWADSQSLDHWNVYIPLESTSENYWYAEALSDLINQRLLNALREKSGATYAVYSSHTISQLQGLMMGFSYRSSTKLCQQAALITAAEITRLRYEAPSLDEVQSVRDKLRKSIEEQANNPMQYADMVSWHWVANNSLNGSKPQLDKLTPTLLYDLANKWLKPSNWNVAACYGGVDLSTWR